MFARYILALGHTLLVPCMAFANVRNTFGQIFGTSPPKAVFKVVAGRFYRAYVRSIYFDACLDTAFGCDVCEIWQKALRTLANAIDCTRRVCPSAKIYRTNIQALKTTGYDLRYGFWLRCLRNLAKSSSHISKCHRLHEEGVSKRQNIPNEHTSPKNDRLRP